MQEIADFPALCAVIAAASSKAAKPLFIGITGLGGSGKSTLARDLKAAFPKRSDIFSIDHFAHPTLTRKEHIHQAQASQDPSAITNAENPQNWYDWPRLYRALDDLRAGHDVSLSDAWDQKTGLCDGALTIKAPKGADALIWVEGIFVAHDEMRKRLDRVILVDTPFEITLARQRARDAHRSDPAYLDFKDRLSREYDQPYIDQHKDRFDWRFTGPILV